MLPGAQSLFGGKSLFGAKSQLGPKSLFGAKSQFWGEIAVWGGTAPPPLSCRKPSVNQGFGSLPGPIFHERGDPELTCKGQLLRFAVRCARPFAARSASLNYRRRRRPMNSLDGSPLAKGVSPFSPPQGDFSVIRGSTWGVPLCGGCYLGCSLGC